MKGLQMQKLGIALLAVALAACGMSDPLRIQEQTEIRGTVREVMAAGAAFDDRPVIMLKLNGNFVENEVGVFPGTAVTVRISDGSGTHAGTIADIRAGDHILAQLNGEVSLHEPPYYGARMLDVSR